MAIASVTFHSDADFADANDLCKLLEEEFEIVDPPNNGKITIKEVRER